MSNLTKVLECIKSFRRYIEPILHRLDAVDNSTASKRLQQLDDELILIQMYIFTELTYQHIDTIKNIKFSHLKQLNKNEKQEIEKRIIELEQLLIV